MLKSFGLTLVLSFVWLNSMAEIALSELAWEETAIDQDYAIDNDLPFCYMQTVNGELMDLTRFCGSGLRQRQTGLTPVSQSSIAPPPAIIVPSSPVARGSACFMFDEEGRPCLSNR
jgi:hypothetical protein